MSDSRGRVFGFRPEIEGLRAVAVLLVVADHLVKAPSGGFIGVDVFFVISGFLITGLLVNEYDRTGKLSVAGFYRRRIRRILPAAVLVLAATLIAARVVFFAARAHQTAVDVVWAALFGANVHFARIGTDYFQADRAQSPVQHFWSLAVEEQFYVVWPVVLFALLWIGKQISRRRPLLVPAIVSGLLVAGLFVWSVQQTSADATGAYFATSSRAWELGVGALLALAFAATDRSSTRAVGHRAVPQALFRAALIGGLVVVLVSAFVVHANTSFPGPAAALPVFGAALVVIGSQGAVPGPAAWVLTNPVSRYLGKVSYSLYLWHWPVIVFVGAEIASSGPMFVLICVCLMSALTIVSHHAIEEPFRTGSVGALLRRGADRARRRAPSAGRIGAGGQGRRPVRAVVVVPACLFMLTFVLWQARPFEPVVGFAPAVADVRPAAAALPYGEVTPSASLAGDIVNALAATTFPALSPSLDELPNSKVPEWKPCGNVGPGRTAACTFAGRGSAAGAGRSIAVLGDSIGITWLPAVRGLQAEGYTVYGLTYGECPAADVTVDPAVGSDARFSQRCDAHRTWAINQIKRLQPTVVVLANSAETINRLADGRTGNAAYAEWKAGTTRTINAVRTAGAGRIVALSPPPTGPSLQTCAASSSARPSDCVGRIGAKWFGLTSAERTAAQAARIRYIDTRLLFCADNDYCPAFIGNRVVRVDGNHLSEPYSAYLAGVLDPLIVG